MGTIRQDIIDILKQRETTATTISEMLNIKEKEVYEHLEHIRRSVRAKKLALKVRPHACRGCGFEFDDRKRLSRPGKCPKCRQQRIDEAEFRIISK